MKLPQTIKLKPCPFCGSDNIELRVDSCLTMISCDDCGGSGPGVGYNEEVYVVKFLENLGNKLWEFNSTIELWNNRTKPNERLVHINLTHDMSQTYRR